MQEMALTLKTIPGTITGVLCGIVVRTFGDHNIKNNMLTVAKATFIGNIAGVFRAPLYIFIISMIKPDKESFDLTLLGKKILLADDYDKEEKKATNLNKDDEKILKRQLFYSFLFNFFILFLVYVMLACILYGINKDFSESSFTAFIIICLIWVVCAALYIILLPLYQGRHSLKFILQHLIKFQIPEHPMGWNESSDESSVNVEGVEIVEEMKK